MVSFLSHGSLGGYDENLRQQELWLTLQERIVTIAPYTASASSSATDTGPHRLAWPRTLPFQGSNTGSNPVGDTT